MNSDVRGRSRDLLRYELADAAATYCSEHGFDSVTVDDIAKAIGVSRATFFRYFTSKEEAVVLAVRTGRVSLAERLRTEPPPRGTPALTAVRTLLTPTVHAARDAPDQLRARIRMIAESDALRAHLAAERAEQRAELEAALVELVSDPLAARAVAHASVAAIDLAWNLWRSDETADFEATLDQAFHLIDVVSSVRTTR